MAKNLERRAGGRARVRSLLAGLILAIGAGAIALSAPPAHAVESAVPNALTSDLRAAISDSVSAALERFYVFPDAAKRMAARLDSSRKAGAFETLSAPEAFATALTRELRRAQDDAHLRITFDPEEAARAVNPSEERRVDISRERKANFHLEQARILPGNVGYLEFTQFADTIAEERIASAPDSQAVRARTFALNQARADAGLVVLSALELSEFAGRFEEYAFAVRDARLYSRNRSRNEKLDRLAPITSTLFSIDRESQVEFLRDGAGVVSSIRIYWNDGWVDTIARSE